MSTDAAQWASQPFAATDLAAFVFAVLAILFVTLWVRDREPGMPWLGAAYGTLGGMYYFRNHMLPTGLQPNQLWSTLAVVMLITIGLGLAGYVRTPARAKRWLYPFMFLPSFVVLGAFVLGIPVVRPYTALPVACTFIGVSGLCLWAMRREPGAGHGYIALALFSIPACIVGAVLLKVDSFFMQFYVLPPLLLFGLTLLTVSLMRRRRELERESVRRLKVEQALAATNAQLLELNATLEARVAERTRDLHDMIAGLEGFTRNVSHDLRGPLGGIAGLARLGAERMARHDAAAVGPILAAIAEQADSSMSLMTALLTLARVSDATVDLVSVNPGPIVQDVLKSLAVTNPQASSIELVVSELPPVLGDADLMRVAFTNLIGNAIKFSRHSPHPRVEVGATASGDGVSIYVRDNGEGFDAASATRLFQPFVRLHGNRFEGHGVGLSIVRRAVERQGGKVQAESSPQGACFRMLLRPAPMTTPHNTLQ